MGIHDRQIVLYRIEFFDETKGVGTARDAHDVQYNFSRKDLVEEMQGYARAGERVEAFPQSWDRITEIRGAERPSNLEPTPKEEISPEKQELLGLILK